MEIEADEARRHLQQLDRASLVSERASVTFLPYPYFLGIACLGPSLVWFATVTESELRPALGASEANLLSVGAFLFGAVAAASLIATWRYEKVATPVRPKAPIRGGRTTVWVLLYLLALLIPSITAFNLVTIEHVNQPYLLAIVLFAWLALAPAYCWRRHVDAMRTQGS